MGSRVAYGTGGKMTRRSLVTCGIVEEKLGYEVAEALQPDGGKLSLEAMRRTPKSNDKTLEESP